MNSDLHDFHKLSVDGRLELIKKIAGLTDDETKLLKNFGNLGEETANRMIENVVGSIVMPLGIATNFMINGRDYLIPMALEEPSVVAAASKVAKIVREAGGFTASSDEPVMIGQVQLVGVTDFSSAKKNILAKKEEIKEMCNRHDATLVKFGGGFRGIDFHEIETEAGKMLIVNLLIDVRDAMGANAVNTMAEAAAPFLEEITGAKVRLKIISNLAIHRKARAMAVFTKKSLEASFKNREMRGDEIVSAVLEAYHFAKNDVFRCATHNKGIMNGVDAVTIATGNDFRAVEAGAHSFAAIDRYHPLTKYYKNEKGDLVGEIELPLALGLIGGATKTNPIAQIALKILDVRSSQELACVIASVGLAQNFAAMRALATEGIQEGHMRLHARNIAVTAGATGGKIDEVAARMVSEKNISVARAKEILEEM